MPQKKTMQKNEIPDERIVRLDRLDTLKKAGIEAYPAKSERTHALAEARRAAHGTKVIVAGRVMTKREIGRITFCSLQDESGHLQMVLKSDEAGEEVYSRFASLVDAGDILEIRGERFVSKTGEESVMVRSWRMLAKALLPLPEKFHGLQDEELRLRRRYLDLLLHPDLRELFRRKARFWQSMRAFLAGEKFLEVETPVLEVTTGGADATPFVTHHNALDLDVYLRISNGELWQKRLMVAGFEKTFELGRQFRNEGMSREHLQDYSQMEFYWAYADYKQGMALVERLYRHVIQETYGRLVFSIGEFSDIDFSKPWGRISYSETIKKSTGIDVLVATEKDLRRTLEKLRLKHSGPGGRGRLLDALWKHCRKSVKGPVFLTDLPVAVSPLAKRKKDKPEIAERYQVIAAGSELGNGYSELNDPLDQAERFAEQSRLREAGDTEAQMNDADFVEALEHGMPPTTGFGVSERLFAFLENRPVRECVLFPLLKPV